MNQKENFTYRYPSQNTNYINNKRETQVSNAFIPQTKYKRAKTENNGRTIIEDINYNPFAYDAVELDVNDPQYVSNNYKIVGKPNPKTLIPPIIVPPIADLSYWKSNNLVTHSHINDNKNIDVFQSGYAVSNYCGDNTCRPRMNNYKKVNEGNQQSYNTNHNQKYHQKYMEHQISTHKPITENFQINQFDMDEKIENIGLVNKSCGYNNRQMKNNLPVNLSVGKCQTNPSLNEYNKNLFTEIIQPGVYSTNQVNEPINSNMGISFTQQFEPLSMEENEFGVTFTEHDPLDENFNPKDNILKYNINDVVEPVTQSNVYDPRFSGYGTSYRAYNDDNTGQTKFFYDDIDSIRMPNYVTRSKIDFADFADTYGPMNNENGNTNNSNIRALANQKFLDDSILFRTGMQERLMRKVNADGWQRRQKPINTSTQRMMGNKGW